ncbi:hypothetical protein ABBQ32_001311 [Trebouxia sp. C0010 RCD-2024]
MSHIAGPPSPTLSLPEAPARSGQYGASILQAASSLPASSIPGSIGSPQMSYGALARPLAGSRRPHRSDLSQGHTPQRGRRLSLPATSGMTGGDSEAMSEDGGTEHNNTFVWGTNLVIGDIQARIQKFMRSFVQEGSTDALYTTLIKQALDDEEVFLNIDLLHLHQYDKQLYGQLVAYPGEVIPLLDAEARYIAEDLLGGEELPEEKLLTVRPFNLAEHKVIRDLNPDDMNKLISVTGMVTRSSSIIPDPRSLSASQV